MEILRDQMDSLDRSSSQRNELMKEQICFLDCRFDTGTVEQASREILAETREQFKYVVTSNVYYLVRMFDDPATMRPQYEGAWRVFCDSRVLSRLARLIGVRLPVVTGSDLTVDLITHAAKCRWTIAIIGPT